MSRLDKRLKQALEAREQAHLYRRRRTLDSTQSPIVKVDGRECLAFCSNDYLGLAADPRLSKALQQGAELYGSGSGASHLVLGHSRAHHQLEEALAEHTGRERVLLFSTGYMANLGAIAALSGRGDQVIQDKLNHASLLDGGLLSGARFKRFRHADMSALESALSSSTQADALVVTDGVFSMDGDIAPLPEMARLCEQHQAHLLVDDAHGFGALGKNGGGVAELYNLDQTQLPILIGTLGKAFGTGGAFVAGSETLIEYLIQFARPYIYTTAMPPAIAHATLESLRIVRAEQWRRDKLTKLIQQFRAGVESMGLELMASETAIQPILIGEADKAIKLSQALEQQGVFVGAIRPPTVPAGSARLRITLSAAHTEEQVNRLLNALDQAAGELRG
ncbi:MAG TPA: 8-amino-7-oxononanoate synthase [Marinobacterium sp.]|nr:8-amino-7-oxononanoate synthase [Marinobacterium sp.]